MNYKLELNFICDVLNKSHINVCVVSKTSLIKDIVDSDIYPLFEQSEITKIPLNAFLKDIKPYTVYRRIDAFNLCYIYFILPETTPEKMLFIGPFVNTPLNKSKLLEVCEYYNIPPANQSAFSEYYLGLRVIPNNSSLFIMLETFYDKIFGINNYVVTDAIQESINFSFNNYENLNSSVDNTLLNINLMEKRYNFENELISAVTSGQIHKADLLFDRVDENSFEKRTKDPIRNMKNYCIIMNTLFRKAAEKGGVMPFYIDKASSSFALKIEQLTTLNESTNLMKDIFRTYCKLVQKQSLKAYSSLVRKAIVFIESDLSAVLTLSTISNSLNVSGAYLSTVFKKETGMTITDFIWDKRIKHAEYLLTSTRLQVQTIALHCGILDVQYFSKVFKKLTGKTPKEYRKVFGITSFYKE